jgi:hypothetical protein
MGSKVSDISDYSFVDGCDGGGDAPPSAADRRGQFFAVERGSERAFVPAQVAFSDDERADVVASHSSSPSASGSVESV